MIFSLLSLMLKTLRGAGQYKNRKAKYWHMDGVTKKSAMKFEGTTAYRDRCCVALRPICKPNAAYEWNCVTLYLQIRPSITAEIIEYLVSQHRL